MKKKQNLTQPSALNALKMPNWALVANPVVDYAINKIYSISIFAN